MIKAKIENFNTLLENTDWLIAITNFLNQRKNNSYLTIEGSN